MKKIKKYAIYELNRYIAVFIKLQKNDWKNSKYALAKIEEQRLMLKMFLHWLDSYEKNKY